MVPVKYNDRGVEAKRTAAVRKLKDKLCHSGFLCTGPRIKMERKENYKVNIKFAF